MPTKAKTHTLTPQAGGRRQADSDDRPSAALRGYGRT